MASDEVLALAALLWRGRDHDDGVLRPVQAGTQHFGHAAIDLDEGIALLAGIHYIDDATDDGTGVAHQEGPGFDFQMQLAAVLAGEAVEFVGHRLASFAQVGRYFVGHAPHLETAAHTHALDLGQLGGHAERQPGAVLPDCWVAARADMAVQAGDVQVVCGGRCQHLVEMLVPDAEARRRTARIGAVAVSRAEPWVDAHGDFAARKELTVGCELMQGTGVEEDALAH